ERFHLSALRPPPIYAGIKRLHWAYARASRKQIVPKHLTSYADGRHQPEASDHNAVWHRYAPHTCPTRACCTNSTASCTVCSCFRSSSWTSSPNCISISTEISSSTRESKPRSSLNDAVSVISCASISLILAIASLILLQISRSSIVVSSR